MAFFAHDREIFTDVLVGCFLMVRREAMDRFGLLDERFFMYAEDVDWCMRCWKAGWKIAFFPGAQAIHYRGGSSVKNRVRMAVQQQQARRQLWEKHYAGLQRLGLVAFLACENGSRWLANALLTALRRGGRDERASRMQENAACLKALLIRR